MQVRKSLIVTRDTSGVASIQIVHLDESQEKLICRSLYFTIKKACFLVRQYKIL